MRNFIGILLSIFLISSIAEARLTDGKVKLNFLDKTLSLKTDSGFHLNADAPAKLTLLPSKKKMTPTKKTNDEFSFGPIDSEVKEIALDYYVCDDKLTTCERHRESYALNGNTLSVIAEKAIDTENKLTASNTSVKLNSHHFIVDNLEAAKSLAKKEKKLLFVDFSAPWCPACLRLETEVFGQKLFINKTKNLIKVSLNMDEAVNAEAFEKYGVNVIPTMILMNDEGTELSRIVDYRTTKELVSLIVSGIKNTKSLENYLLLAGNGNKAAMKYLALHAFDRYDFKNASIWFKKLNELSLPSAVVEINLLQSEKSPGLIETYQKSIQAFPKSFDSIVWRNELAELLPAEEKETKNALLQTNIELIKQSLANKKIQKKMFQETAQGLFTSFEMEELYTRLVTAHDLKGDSISKAGALLILQETLRKRPLSANKSGEVLLAIDYMKEAKMKNEVESWYKKLMKKNVDSDLYPRKLARFYYQEKQHSSALVIAEKAVKLGTTYLFWDLLILAQVQHELKMPETKATVEKALAMPEAMDARNQSYVKDFKKLVN